MYNIEYDPRKSESNKKKHGINFEEVKDIFEDENLIQIPAKTIDEPRYLLVGKIKNIHWSVVITYRASNIRIISARKSRKEERETYEKN